jgi:hypothetical protein
VKRRLGQLPDVAGKNGNYFNQMSSKIGQGSIGKNFAGGRHSSTPWVTFHWRGGGIEKSGISAKQGWLRESTQ